MNKEVLRKLYSLRRNFRNEEDNEDRVAQMLSDRKHEDSSTEEHLEAIVAIEKAEARADAYNYVIRYLDEVIREYEQGEDTFVCTRELRNYENKVLARIGSVWHEISVDDNESIFKECALVNDENELIRVGKYKLTEHFEVKLS